MAKVFIETRASGKHADVLKHDYNTAVVASAELDTATGAYAAALASATSDRSVTISSVGGHNLIWIGTAAPANLAAGDARAACVPSGQTRVFHVPSGHLVQAREYV